MIDHKEIVGRALAYAETQGWKPGRLCREAGLHKNTLRRRDDPEWTPKVETLNALAAVVPADFFEGAAD